MNFDVNVQICIALLCTERKDLVGATTLFVTSFFNCTFLNVCLVFQIITTVVVNFIVRCIFEHST